MFPEAVAQLTGRDQNLKDSGGWMTSAAEQLMASGSHSLVVVSVSSLVRRLTKVHGSTIVYYALPCRREQHYHKEFEAMWKEIVAAEQPDLVHIHGTEFAHGLAFMRINPGIPTLLSIQGVMTAIGQHYLDGLTKSDIIKNTTAFDLFYSGTLFAKKRHYERYGHTIEREMIMRADAVVGRTSFDKEYVSSIKPDAKYFKCNETLRPAFYEDRWSYENCRKHTVFVSQAGYPIKGFHQLLKALSALLQHYPDLQVRVAGPNIIYHPTFKSKVIKTTYSKMIGNWIKKKGYETCVRFLGPLTAEQMKAELLSANVFLSPSSIENSPNSLGEAQLLGVPCVASLVGGVPDFCSEKTLGTVYPFDDVTTLVNCILNALDESASFDNTQMRQVASERHDQQQNAERLTNIYDTLINGCN